MAFTPTGVQFVAKGFSQYMGQLGKADKAQQGLGTSAGGIGSKFKSLGSNILGFGAKLAKVAAGAVAALGAGIVALGAVSIKTAISFESAFAGVLKTTDGLTSSIGVLNEQGEALRQGFVNLSKEVPLAFEELAAIGELGGQLGIGKEALLDFTETITALGVSTNLTTEEAATAIARLGNIYQVASEDMGLNTQRIGSTIVALGNNFATTERDIVAFGERLAGAGKIAGFSQADILGIGTALSSVGVKAEAGGTAVQKVLLQMNNAVNATSDGFVDNSKAIDKNVKKLTKLQAESARLEAQFPGLQSELIAQREAFIEAGGTAEEFGRQLGDKTRQKAFETATAIQELSAETQLLRDQQGQPIDPGQLEKFAKIAGISADEFKQAWEEDAAGAFQMFVEGLGDLGDDAAGALDELGLADQRLIRSFLSLAGAGDLLGDAIDTANTAFEENTALAEEAAQRYATTESKIATLKNTFRAIADSIGRRFLPIINRVIDSAKDLVDKWAGPIEDAIENIIIPAIEKVIDSVNTVITLFQRFGAGGAALGILAILGVGPETIGIVKKIFDGISQVVSGFIEGGIIGALGGAGGGGGVSVILSALGLGEGAIAAVEGFLLRIKQVFLGFSIAEIFGGGVTGGDVAGGILAILGLDETIVTTVQTTIDNIINTISDAIERAKNAIGFGGTAGQVGASFLSAFGLDESVLETVQTIIDGIIGIVQQLPMFFSQAFTFIIENIESFKGALFGVGAVLLGSAVLGALATVGSAIFALLIPINLIIVAAALLGAAWAGNWGNIQGITMSVIATITNLFNTAFPIIQAVVLTAGAVISGVFAGIMSVIMGQVVPSLQAAFANITMALASLGISWSDVWDAVLSAMGIVASVIGVVAAAIGAILLALVAIVVGAIAGIAAAIEVGSQAFLSLVSFLEQAFTGAAQLLVAFVEVWSGIFTGDLPRILEGFKLGFQGLGNFITGIIGSIVSIVLGGLSAIVTAVGTFITSIIDFFTTLSSTLVGNSIIPDMVQAIIDTFTNMIEPVLSIFTTLSEGIGTVIGAIFGGGEGGGGLSLSFDPTEMLAGLELVKAGIAEISDVNLPALVVATVTTITSMVAQWMLFINAVAQTIALILELYTVHLPTLEQVSATTTQSIVDGFLMVNATITQTIAIVNELIVAMQTLGAETKKVIDLMVKGFKEAAKALKEIVEAAKEATKAIGEDFVDAIKAATEAAQKLASALGDAVNAAAEMGDVLASAGLGFSGGAGFQQGVGFQQGTLGFTIPSGFQNDSFMVGLTSGEEILVAPPSMSIDQIVADSFGTGGQTTIIELNDTVINTPMDEAMLVELIRRTIAEDTR